MTSDELNRLLSRAESHLKAYRRDQAKSAYRKVLMNFPQCKEAHFQLAVLLHDEQDLVGAVRHTRALLQLAPELPEGHFNLGTMLSSLGEKSEAANSFRRAIELQPSMADAYNNLGIVFRDLGDLEQAIENFEAAIRIQPQLFSACVNLGATLIKCRRAERAVEVCRAARAMKPEIAETHLALGLALELSGEMQEAQQCLQEAIQLNPKSDEWRFHFAASSGQASPPIAPAAYVVSLFDAYAARFDSHLRGSLNYRIPEQILDAVMQLAPNRKFDIADLGCGTGLCGEQFVPHSKRLVGIDLSPEMIRAADERKIYDELHVSDITGFLKTRGFAFDLILASDVFIYVGDLSETFRLTAAALRNEGLFAFSVEAAEEYRGGESLIDRFHLTSTRRYVHTLAYVRQLLAEFGFSEHCAQLVTLRKQAGVDVQGWIVVSRIDR